MFRKSVRPDLSSQGAWIGLLVLAAAMFLPSGASGYGGMLTTIDFGLIGTGNWIQDASQETWLEWTVSQDAGNVWHYSYTLSHPVGETSHFILEVSKSFTYEDILDSSGSFSGIDIGLQRVDSGNPNMPEDVYGIRFKNARGMTSQFSFSTYRAPVWGDFYAKNGNAGGYGVNTVWNAGFTAGDVDPLGPPQNGSLNRHVLVPDTVVSDPVPEPASLLLLGAGLLGAAVVRRRKR